VYYHKRILVFVESNSYSCRILTKLDFERFFDKYSNTKFDENPSSGSRVVPCGRTGTTKLIVAFRKFAKSA